MVSAARQRALNEFRLGRVRVLVATDVAARGIDVDDISHVINFELPNDSESYIHRIGRTARAGAAGSAISFCDSEERAYLKDIEKLTKQAIPVVLDQPYHSMAVASGPLLSKAKAKAIIEGRGGRRSPQARRFGKKTQRFGPGGPRGPGGHGGGGGSQQRRGAPTHQGGHR
jgi:ATP-dependent RNA helicase RhlE